MPGPAERHDATSGAILGAAAMIAHQVGGKATRDTLFLSSFDVTSLPIMLIGASLFSLVLVVAMSRAMTRLTPAWVVPRVFILSAILTLGEWALFYSNPRLTAVLVYLHMAGLAGVLISGFWSVVNERFDPRSAKQQVGRIAGGATLGGVIGGFLAERTGAVLSVAAMFPILSFLHVVSAAMVYRLQPVHPVPGKASTAASGSDSALEIFKKAPYLQNLAALVLLATISGVAVDYVFKSQATQTFGRGENLLRFFAFFYTILSVGTFAVQAAFVRPSLQNLGLAKTVGLLPMVIAAGGTGALLAPSLATASLARGFGNIVNDSLFRSGYELLYAPIPAAEKRATKALVDVGFGRAGDFIGGGVVRLILEVAPSIAVSAILSVGIGFALLGLWIASRLNRGYVISLERNLLDRAVDLDLSEVQDGATRSAIMKALRPTPDEQPLIPGPFLSGEFAGEGKRIYKSSVELPALRQPMPQQVAEAPPPVVPLDPLSQQILALRSGNLEKTRRALRSPEGLNPALVPHVISLLAWDDVFPEALAVLRDVAPGVTGQLLDVLLDPEQPFAVRRRIPRVFSAAPTQRAAEGLLLGIADRRFEVRFQCGLMLEYILSKNSAIEIPAPKIIDAVMRELKVGKKVWESHRLLDRAEEMTGSPFVDESLRDRADRTLEHVFRLLSFILPKEPLRVAYRGLHTDDLYLRGTALEYLETVLPVEIRDRLWPFLEDRRSKPRGEERSLDEVVATLLRSHESIELNLSELRKKVAAKQSR
jgi:ATP:ADP antiporter, AAA family